MSIHWKNPKPKGNQKKKKGLIENPFLIFLLILL